MAKVSAVERDKKRSRLVNRFKVKRGALKAIIMDKSLPMEERFAATQQLADLPRNGAKTRLRNRCSQSGRPRGYYRKLGLSRIALREMGSDGMVPGLVKSSW